MSTAFPSVLNRLACTFFLSSICIAAAACAQDATSPANGAQSAAIPAIRLEPAFPKLTFQRPVFITHAPEPHSNLMLVVEQSGRILALENRSDVSETQVFLDIRAKVRMRHNEEGLLSLVFHPKFAQNGQFFVYYSVSNPKRNRIARYTMMKDEAGAAAGGLRGDPDSEQAILEVEQKYGNHNGSTLLFGPDGFLYASFGDGGLADDPHLNGQNLGTLLASIIRIDVDRAEGDKPYAIPGDNPFVNRAGARPEIWAYGLRNVWRMSFDRKTGDLWAGDVGQNLWEEIDVIVKGGNYGWPRREGEQVFHSGEKRLADKPLEDPLINPVIDYPRRDGISVTGGYVYRGQKFPQLQGVYIYADYGSRNIWGLRYENGQMTAHRKIAGGAESSFITSFGEDAAGELYACAFDRPDDGRPGRVFKIVAN